MFIVRFKNTYEPVPLFLCLQLKSINLNIQSSNDSVKISLLRAWRLPSGSEEAACASCDYGCISGQFASQDKRTRGRLIAHHSHCNSSAVCSPTAEVTDMFMEDRKGDVLRRSIFNSPSDRTRSSPKNRSPVGVLLLR